MESYLSTHSKFAGFAPTKKATSSLAKDMKTASYMEMLVAGGPVLHGAGEPQTSPMGVTVVLGVPSCSAVGCSFWLITDQEVFRPGPFKPDCMTLCFFG